MRLGLARFGHPLNHCNPCSVWGRLLGQALLGLQLVLLGPHPCHSLGILRDASGLPQASYLAMSKPWFKPPQLFLGCFATAAPASGRVETACEMGLRRKTMLLEALMEKGRSTGGCFCTVWTRSPCCAPRPARNAWRWPAAPGVLGFLVQSGAESGEVPRTDQALLELLAVTDECSDLCSSTSALTIKRVEE